LPNRYRVLDVAVVAAAGAKRLCRVRRRSRRPRQACARSQQLTSDELRLIVMNARVCVGRKPSRFPSPTTRKRLLALLPHRHAQKNQRAGRAVERAEEATERAEISAVEHAAEEERRLPARRHWSSVAKVRSTTTTVTKTPWSRRQRAGMRVRYGRTMLKPPALMARRASGAVDAVAVAGGGVEIASPARPLALIAMVTRTMTRTRRAPLSCRGRRGQVKRHARVAKHPRTRTTKTKMN